MSRKQIKATVLVTNASPSSVVSSLHQVTSNFAPEWKLQLWQASKVVIMHIIASWQE